MAKLIKMQFGMLSLVSPRYRVLDGHAHWRHLPNTTEPSVCGGDAVLCEITLTACCCFFFRLFVTVLLFHVHRYQLRRSSEGVH